MRTYFILFICILTGLRVSGQSEPGYGEGTIVTRQGETINCFIEMTGDYEKVVFYKETRDGRRLSIPVSEVKAMATPITYFENIPLGKKEKLMTLVIDGRAQLFIYVTEYVSQPLVYVLKKDGVYYELRKKNYIELLVLALRDCPHIIDVLGSRKFVNNLQDLERIVTEYNSCQIP